MFECNIMHVMILFFFLLSPPSTRSWSNSRLKSRSTPLPQALLNPAYQHVNLIGGSLTFLCVPVQYSSLMWGNFWLLTDSWIKVLSCFPQRAVLCSSCSLMHYSGITSRELYAVIEKIPKSGSETSLGCDMSTYYSVYASNFTCRCEFFLLL